MNAILLRDKEVARLLGMSQSWVRVQRWKRSVNQPHSLNVNALMIGKAPRYRLSDIEEWLDALEAGESDAS